MNEYMAMIIKKNIHQTHIQTFRQEFLDETLQTSIEWTFIMCRLLNFHIKNICFWEREIVESLRSFFIPRHNSRTSFCRLMSPCRLCWWIKISFFLPYLEIKSLERVDSVVVSSPDSGPLVFRSQSVSRGFRSPSPCYDNDPKLKTLLAFLRTDLIS